MTRARDEHDAIVVGAGLAGLTAALHLQRAGRRTVLIERRAKVGGLCGTFAHEGHEFVVGCNDFGAGLERELHELGVEISFHHPRTAMFFEGGRVEHPPGPGTALRLLRKLPAIARAILGARHADTITLGQLVDRHVRDPWLADVACLPAFAMMRSPDDVMLSAIAADFSKEHGYGYDVSATPVGGPQAMADAMARRFRELGGALLLEHACLARRREGTLHVVETPTGELRARALLSSEGRWGFYPPGTKKGLEVASLLLAMEASFPFPDGLHAIDGFPRGLASVLRALEGGRPVGAFPVHLFRADLRPRDGLVTANALLVLPRGERALAPARRHALQQHALATLDVLLPGFSAAVRGAWLLDPIEYAERVGLSCAPSRYVPPLGFGKPPSYDAARDIHFIGVSAGPPGDHAGAAVRSGSLAARSAQRALEASRAHRPINNPAS
jgi:phytoene dehydrogenase-like protein